ncbi:uncharacterized protein GLRG_08861 [Colletotrichum graminicola M1.001]|uniref:Uncharacterized protein n=1 Tax=Colletotrichum graminicola (strain M1.001 / M2 / FGSC 10212) TaxID=645133 RepID=E3QS90_COLGM|nr:uncharacterized protein GLRG_08861 [Colletotrichum graminicola M1.001]EFQ33717.1 hypothetical protein GLRG_08861 [Colletotrichum graminicola M1.001]
MQLSVLLGTASFAAVTSASLPPINLGHVLVMRENLSVAWSPFTPTTTQDLYDFCDPSTGTRTWNAIRAVSSGYATGPVCRNPFNVTDVNTGITYYELELACVDDDIPWTATPEVTAVVDRATNKAVETCVPALFEDGSSTETLCNTGGGYSLLLGYDFACTSV